MHSARLSRRNAILQSSLIRPSFLPAVFQLFIGRERTYGLVVNAISIRGGKVRGLVWRPVARATISRRPHPHTPVAINRARGLNRISSGSTNMQIDGSGAKESFFYRDLRATLPRWSGDTSSRASHAR